MESKVQVSTDNHLSNIIDFINPVEARRIKAQNELLERNLCGSCGAHCPPKTFRSAESWSEYQISLQCQWCQDTYQGHDYYDD